MMDTIDLRNLVRDCRSETTRHKAGHARRLRKVGSLSRFRWCSSRMRGGSAMPGPSGEQGVIVAGLRGGEEGVGHVRIRCSARIACYSSLFTATVRASGNCAAVQIACASCASSLLPETNGRDGVRPHAAAPGRRPTRSARPRNRRSFSCVVRLEDRTAGRSNGRRVSSVMVGLALSLPGKKNAWHRISTP